MVVKFKKNILFMVLVFVLFLVVINTVYATTSAVDECNSNIDCDDGISITDNVCIQKGPTVAHNFCTHYSYLKGYRCNSDSQCEDGNPMGNNQYTKDVCEYDSDLGFRTCKHYVKSTYSCDSNSDCVDENSDKLYKCFNGLCNYFDKNYTIYGDCNEEIPHFKSHDSSKYDLLYEGEDGHYCRYSPIISDFSIRACSFSPSIDYDGFVIRTMFYSNSKTCTYELFNLCDEDVDCIDDDPYTKDSCKRINEHNSGILIFPGHSVDVCMHEKSSVVRCLTDAECFNMTPDNPYDLEICTSEGYCESFYDDEDSLNLLKRNNIDKSDRIKFNKFLNYIPKINFLGYLNNGEVEEFTVDVKTAKVTKGLSPDAFLLIEIHQNAFEELKNKIYKRYDESTFYYKSQGFFNKERLLFASLLSYSSPYVNSSKVVKINNWDQLFAKIQTQQSMSPLGGYQTGSHKIRNVSGSLPLIVS